jgi:hypothetical protein
MSWRQIERAATLGSDWGDLDDTNYVTIVPDVADADLVREVDSVRFVNLDTGAVDLTVWIFDGASTYDQIDQSLALAANGKFVPVDGDNKVRLGNGFALVAKLGGATSSDQPIWYATWRDVPVPA